MRRKESYPILSSHRPTPLHSPTNVDGSDPSAGEIQQRGTEQRIQKQDLHREVVITREIPEPAKHDIREVEGQSQDLKDGKRHKELCGGYRVRNNRNRDGNNNTVRNRNSHQWGQGTAWQVFVDLGLWEKGQTPKTDRSDDTRPHGKHNDPTG
mmetsp:Transcript_18668/g.21413  ORF Transcript_18668/g.21413 Transcript_18668/m.21413 type:complete len:153 (-) Transcript_18668:73-531(-)